jgi:hypothetical protein
MKCEAVFARYGLEQSSLAVIGADRQPEFPDWRVMISDDVAPIYLNVRIATLCLSPTSGASGDRTRRPR